MKETQIPADELLGEIKRLNKKYKTDITDPKDPVMVSLMAIYNAPDSDAKGARQRVSARMCHDVLGVYKRLGGPNYLEVLATTKPELFVRLVEKLFVKELDLNIGVQDGVEDVLAKAREIREERKRNFIDVESIGTTNTGDRPPIERSGDICTGILETGGQERELCEVQSEVHSEILGQGVQPPDGHAGVCENEHPEVQAGDCDDMGDSESNKTLDGESGDLPDDSAREKPTADMVETVQDVEGSDSGIVPTPYRDD